MRKSELRSIIKEIILSEIAFPEPTQAQVMAMLQQKFGISREYYCNLVAWQYGQIISGNKEIKMHPRDVVILATIFHTAITQHVPDNEIARIFTRELGIRDAAKNLISAKQDIAQNPSVLLSLNNKAGK